MSLVQKLNKGGLDESLTQTPGYIDPTKYKRPAAPEVGSQSFEGAEHDEMLARGIFGGHSAAFRKKFIASRQAKRAKLAERQALTSAIADAPAALREEKRLLLNEGNSALSEGLKNTRQNYNSRGLLYSGLRQSGEQSLRGQMASTLAAQQVGATRDSNKLVSSYQQQLAAKGLKSSREAAARAEATFEAKMRSDIARRQALQQLTEGVGYGVGAFYGSTKSDGSETDTGSMPERKRFYGSNQYLSPEDY